MSLTRCIAIDCEMVGGTRGENLAARVTLVNEHGEVVLDKFINPMKPIGDYRTEYSGIKPQDLSGAESLAAVRAQVQRMISGRILVGHSLDADLEALGVAHPEQLRRDLAQRQRYRNLNGGQPASLKLLAERILGRRIQTGPHSSEEDAIATMDIYKADRW